MASISSILEQARDGVKAICHKYNWQLSTASDPFAVFDVLYQNPGKGVVIVGYEGKTVHQQVSRSVVSKLKFSVTASTQRHLVDQMGGIMSHSVGSLSLLEMLDLLEAEILAMDFENELSECNAHFESCQPLTTPEGLPLDAFKLSFWIYNAGPVKAPESSSESSSESSAVYLELTGGYAGVAGLYEPTGTDILNGIDFTRWEKGTYSVFAMFQEDQFGWQVKNGETTMYWVYTGSTPIQSPAGLTLNINTPYWPAPVVTEA